MKIVVIYQGNEYEIPAKEDVTMESFEDKFDKIISPDIAWLGGLDKFGNEVYLPHGVLQHSVYKLV